jgi:hypothetical protein
MRIKKTFVGVFLVTFLIGYVSVLSANNEKSKFIESTDSIKPSEKVSNTTPIPKMEALETIEEINAWSDEDNYPLKIRLLEIGQGYHGAEVKAKSGEVWLGLFHENDGYYLRPAELKIRRVYDEILDGDDKRNKTGKDVSVKGKNQPIYLLKNTGTIRAGKIPTIFQGLSWTEAMNDEESDLPIEEMLTTLKKDFAWTFEFNGKQYLLKVVEAKNKENDRIRALILESDGVRQVLHTIKEEHTFKQDWFYDVGHLYWVGDLDRDGKPDFYFDLFEHYNQNNQVLFISSQAEKGKLIKKVAYFYTTGEL